MNDFTDADPWSWLDDSQVLVVRQSATERKHVRGLASEVRNVLSSVVFGLSVAGLTSLLSVSSSDHIVRSASVVNERSENGLSRRYWEGLAHALDHAPDVADYQESEEVAPLL